MSEFETVIRQIEDKQYQDTQRLHIVPPHYVLINPVDQADYDRLVTKDRRRVILEKGFLTNPEGQMMESGENLLAVVNDAVFQRPWSRLDLEFQINRILVYLGALTLDPKVAIKLRKALLNACFRRELDDHQVIYDCQVGRIQTILGLSYPEVKLEILPRPSKIVPVVGVSHITNANNISKMATPQIKIKTRELAADEDLPKKKMVVLVKKKNFLQKSSNP